MKQITTAPFKRGHLLAGVAVVLLASCASQQASAPASVVQTAVAPEQSLENRLQSILTFLQAGHSVEADAALQEYLKDAPDSKAAHFLQAQIETPIDKLYPAGSFTIRLSRNQNLATIAHVYLGNSMAFYGLARYNGIAIPAKVLEGQTIRIPKTPEALAAQKAPAPLELRSADDSSTPPPQTSAAIVVPASPKVDKRKTAKRYYQDGLIAFQRQDLATAIKDWDASIALDPENNEAKVYLAQALMLQKNLNKLKK